MKTNKREEKNGQLKTYAKFSGIAAQMCVTIYLGNLLGEYLDVKIPNDGEYFSKGVTLFAVFLSMYMIISQVTKITSDQNDKENN